MGVNCSYTMHTVIKFVIFLSRSHKIFIFKHKITWGLNDHMAATIYSCMGAFDAVISRLPVDRSFDQKGSLIIAFTVILFFSSTSLHKEGLEAYHRF